MVGLSGEGGDKSWGELGGRGGGGMGWAGGERGRGGLQVSFPGLGTRLAVQRLAVQCHLRSGKFHTACKCFIKVTPDNQDAYIPYLPCEVC